MLFRSGVATSDELVAGDADCAVESGPESLGDTDEESRAGDGEGLDGPDSGAGDGPDGPCARRGGELDDPDARGEDGPVDRSLDDPGAGVETSGAGACTCTSITGSAGVADGCSDCSCKDREPAKDRSVDK